MAWKDIFLPNWLNTNSHKFYKNSASSGGKFKKILSCEFIQTWLYIKNWKKFSKKIEGMSEMNQTDHFFIIFGKSVKNKQ